MSGILIRKAVGMMSENPKNFVRRVVPAIVLPAAGMILALLALMFSIRSETLEKLLEGAETPYAVIEAYEKWYGLIAAATLLGLVIVVVCGVAAIIIGRKSAAAVFCAIGISVVGLFTCSVMYLSEDISELRTRAREDLEQIREGQLESAEVSFGKNVEKSGLPGPYADGQPTMFSLYDGMGAGTDGRWRGYCILDNLGFAPDENRLYNDNKSIDWNNENAGWYAITYTTNFHVIISVEPLN